MIYALTATNSFVWLPDPGNVGASWTLDGAGGGPRAGLGGVTNNTPVAGITKVNLAVADLIAPGNFSMLLLDGGGAAVGNPENGWVFDAVPAFPGAVLRDDVRAAVGLAAANLDTQLAALTPLSAAGVRAAVGLAAANLDTQLGGLSTLNPAGVRAAVGLAAANLDTQLAAILAASGGLDAAGVRAAVGLAAANLDTQLAGIGVQLTPAGVRAAIGLAMANLDAQLAAIGAPLTPAGVRSALGMAAANMDQQFDSVRPTGTSPAGIRAALGVAQPNLDAEITARNEALETLLERFPSPATEVVGRRS